VLLDITVLAGVGPIVLTINHVDGALKRSSRTRTEILENQPSWEDRKTPKCEVEVNTTDLSEQRQGSNAVADSLPGGFGTSEEGREPNDLVLSVGEMMNNEVARESLDHGHVTCVHAYSQEEVV
jgi:hypothetical protein